MPDPIETLRCGHGRFRAGYLTQNRDRFERLAREGQDPRIALVSCCDSRVEPGLVFDCDPGSLFVIRNVANLVPPREQGGMYHGTSAALEFAVLGLDVAHVAVLGHSGCGGIRALLYGTRTGNQNLDFVERWMRIAAPVREQALAAEGLDEAERLALCEREGIRLSLRNLRSFPTIASRVAEGRLALHGWYFDVAEARVHVVEEATGELRPMVED